MATIVELPRLSDTMEEGVIAKWHVAVGDKVKRGQVIADVETDKATMEFESFDSGTVLKLIAAEGESMAIGTPIAILGKPGENPDAASPAKDKSASEEAPAAKAAPKGESAPKAEPAAKGQPAAKGDVDPPASDASPKREAAQAGIEKSEPSEASPKANREDDERIAASPLARRMAREHDLPLSAIEGSGPHGRIVKTDIEAAIAKGGKPAATGAKTTVATGPGGRPYFSQPDAPQKLSQMRKAIARRMAQANTEIPHFYLTTDVDMGAAVGLRDELKKALPDTKVSFNDLVLLATAKALETHPEVNAYWDGQTIVRRGDIHLGVAVALDEGLIVPVVRFANQKSLKAIATEVRDLGTRARDKRLSPDEMSGSTFTVSNLGMFGISDFCAVVNPGEGAILAVGAITDEVVVVGGAPAVGKRMRITLSCDHRVMDGAVGAAFLATLRGLLQQPLSMLA